MLEPYGRQKTAGVCGAYAIKHVKSGRYYVGSTADIAKRRASHTWRLRSNTHDNALLQEAFNDDAQLEFFTVLADTREDAYNYEQEMIDKYSSDGLLFNKASNARKPSAGARRSQEWIDMLVRLNTGRKHTSETRAKMRAAWSAGNRDMSKSEEFKKKVSKALTGRKLQESTKEKLRLLATGRSRPVSLGGVVYSGVSEAVKLLGMPENTIRGRMKKDAFPDWGYATSSC